MRNTPVRGPAIDLGEFERRLRGPERRSAGGADPLSELARLMHGDEAAGADPYSRILAEPRPAHVPAAELRGSYDPAPAVAAEPRYYPEQPYEPGPLEPAYPMEPAYPGEPDYQEAQQHYAEPHAEAAYHGAEGGWSDDAQYLDYGQADDDEYDPHPRGLRGWLRPWHAVVAISLVAVASIGWAFWHRSGSDASRELATITAPEGPVKVKPAAGTETSGPDAGGAAVLDRKEPAPVKQIVTNQEQAIDPTVAPRAVQLGNGPVDAPHEPARPTVAPRKVKTVTVRPDGSRVDDAALPPAVAMATRAAPDASAAPPLKSGGPTPASAAKPATTPKAAKVKPPAQNLAALEQPAEADVAAPASAPSSGGFAVQFGAAGSEAEARALMKTVVAKYGSQLGGLKPTFKMATVGEKTVYRVRVAGMSKDSANAICGRVKAGGGACFVAGN